MNRVFDVSELIKRLIKYLVEGLMVALVAYAIPKKSLDLEEIGMIALAAAATFRDSTAELWGKVTPWEQQACNNGSRPAPSFPSRSTVGRVQSSSQ